MKQGNLFRLHKEKVDAWLEWSEYLKNHSHNVRETLQEEGIAYEGSLVFEMGGETYVCLFALKDEDVDSIRSANLDHEINIRHREVMKECFAEKVSTIAVSYFFSSK